MSDKRKNAPASPEEERAQLRQLTRELHEAAQDARDAARELRNARDEITADAAKAALTATNPAVREVTAIMARAKERMEQFEQLVIKETTRAVEDIENNHARLMGFKDSTEFSRFIVGEVFTALATTPQFHRDVAAAIKDPNPAQVMVGTREQLAAYVAGGGDPGYVIDSTRLGAAQDGDGAVVDLAVSAGAAGDDEERDAGGHVQGVPLVIVGHAGHRGVRRSQEDDGHLRDSGDPAALAVDGVYHPLGAQNVERADDGAARYLVVRGKLVLRRELLAQLPDAVGYLLADPRGNARELGPLVPRPARHICVLHEKLIR